MNAQSGEKVSNLTPVSADAVPSVSYAVVRRVPTVEEYNRVRGVSRYGFSPRPADAPGMSFVVR